MLPKLPKSLLSLSKTFENGVGGKTYLPPLTRKEKIAEIKRKFNLHHGKGKRKKKRR